MRRPLRFLVLAWFLSACGRSSAPQAERENPPPPASEPPRYDYLVWVRDTTEALFTYRIDDEGRVLESKDGIFLAIDGVEWEWRKEPITLKSSVDEGCHDVEGESSATRASLVRRSDGWVQTIVRPPDPDDFNGDFTHAVTLERSVGPFLFITESTYVDGCAAHGSGDAQAIVWDVRHGAVKELAPEIENVEALRSKALTALKSSDDADADDADEADQVDEVREAHEANEMDDVTLAELRPKYTAEGKLELSLRFTGFACFACSDGDWSSYSRSAFVSAPTLPSSLAPYAEVPAAVRSFVRAHPELELGGFGVLNAR